jgi:hypothetical protein
MRSQFTPGCLGKECCITRVAQKKVKFKQKYSETSPALEKRKRGFFCIWTFYGILNTCPTLILLMLVMLLAEAMAATVVPNLIAIDVSESPDFTV